MIAWDMALGLGGLLVTVTGAVLLAIGLNGPRNDPSLRLFLRAGKGAMFVGVVVVALVTLTPR